DEKRQRRHEKMKAPVVRNESDVVENALGGCGIGEASQDRADGEMLRVIDHRRKAAKEERKREDRAAQPEDEREPSRLEGKEPRPALRTPSVHAFWKRSTL